MEGDEVVAVELDHGTTISTHALTWRATEKTQILSLALIDFYPRPHMEGDMKSP